MDWIDRTIETSGWIAVILSPFLLFHLPFARWSGFLLGVLVQLVTLTLLKRIVLIVFEHRSNQRKLACYLLLKYPIFYGLFFSVFRWLPVSVGAVAVGYALPLVVLIMKGRVGAKSGSLSLLGVLSG